MTTVYRKGYTFIKFYAPWCGHCQEMAYDWEKLGESNRDKPLPGVDLTIGEVDCVDNALLCLKQGVDSYPTIKLYSSDGSVEDYLYARVLLRMQRYLVDKLIGGQTYLFSPVNCHFFDFADINLLPSNSIGTVTLNDYTFQKFIETNKNVVVKFFTTWCPHCVNFKETFDEVVIKFLMEESEDVKFAEVDCMDMDSLEVCSDENVEGFPAVYLYKVKKTSGDVSQSNYFFHLRKELLRISSLMNELLRTWRTSSGPQWTPAEWRRRWIHSSV